MDAVLVTSLGLQVWEHQRCKILLVSLETLEQLVVLDLDVSVPLIPLVTVILTSKELHVLHEPFCDLL